MDLFIQQRSAALELDLLGPPEVRFEGQPLTFRTKKSLALLVYLAVTGTSQPREHLAALFWPDSAEASARATLRSTARFARHALADIRAMPASESILCSGIDRLGREALWLQCPPEAGGVSLDLHRVDRAVTVAHHIPAASERSSAEDPGVPLTEAVQACRGTFLDGFFLSDAPLFEDWMTRQRSYWQGRMDQVFAALCALQLQRGAFAATAETAEHWLRINPLQEAAYSNLMEAQAGLGDRDAALITYARCRQTLSQVLGVEPIPETVALAERLRASMRSLVRSSEGHQPSRPWLAAPPARSWRALETPLVGRMSEFASLVAAYERTQRGTLQLVVIAGEAGVGKTRLAREFLQWAYEARGAEILRGRAFETGGRLPYQPLTEALRARLEREHAPEDLLDDVWLAELSRILPDLRERYPDLVLPAIGEDAGAQGRLFEALAQLGLALLRQTSPSVNKTLVLFLDDLQWADVGTIDLIHFLIRRWNDASARVLVLLAVRQEELQTSSTLREWLHHLAQEVDETATAHLSLEPLDSVMVQTLVDEVFVEPADTPPGIAQIMPTFAQTLYQETSGLPLSLVQMLRALLEQGVLAWGEERMTVDGQLRLRLRTPDISQLQGMLPATLQAAIQSRLERLAPCTRHLLTAGAILGARFRPEHAWSLADIDEVTGLDALDEAERHMIIRMIAGGTECEFRHAHMRHVLYDSVGMVRRKVFHRRALALLERAGGATADELEHHARMAGLDAPARSYSSLPPA